MQNAIEKTEARHRTEREQDELENTQKIKEVIGQVRNAADHGSDADEGGLTWLVTNETAIVFPILVAIIIKDIYDRNFNHDIKV